jgi:hypothetical protein
VGEPLHAGDQNHVPMNERLRIGVTGHRRDQPELGDAPALAAQIRAVLEQIGGSTGGPGTLISSIAEGADQIAAEEALALGFRLVCPLPFSRAEYERDFLDERSRATYRSLLRRASEVQELPGTRTHSDSEQLAYAAAGDRVLKDAELLIAIWNGSAARGTGGTAEVVAKAVRAGIPTVWISALPPHSVQLLEPISDIPARVRPAARAIERDLRMLAE